MTGGLTATFGKNKDMKRYFLFLGIFITMATMAQVIYIPYAAAPQIDGTIKGNEWINAGSTDISINANTAGIEVLFQHDNSNLYIAYLGNLQTAGFKFPEVLIDVNNHKSTVWMSDDWWFHVSATDCEYQGTHSNYDSCMLIRPNWTAAPNFHNGPVVDTVEIAIPFSTIGFNINTMDTMGISFAVNDFIIWEYWPVMADINNPSTWGHAVFGMTTGLREVQKQDAFVHLFPNPSTDGRFTLSSDHPMKGELVVYNVLGKVVLSKVLSGAKREVVDLGELEGGMYVVRFDGWVGKVLVGK